MASPFNFAKAAIITIASVTALTAARDAPLPNLQLRGDLL